MKKNQNSLEMGHLVWILKDVIPEVSERSKNLRMYFQNKMKSQKHLREVETKLACF